ncbi:MAG TPA: flagellar basal body P-ring formation chaperone FlgA [Rhodocyclaceae bacterium]|nr:flagellar basal body P-ring formation chaperone FlgA [Rhodocyclaceae bacterium]
MNKSLSALLFCTLLAPLPAFAISSQDVANVATSFLQERTQGLPGIVSVTVTPPSDRQQIMLPCTQAQAFLPQGQKTWGHVTVEVRCINGANSTLYISGRVKVEGSYVKMTRTVSGGQSLAAADMRVEQGDLTAYPDDLIVNPGDAIGLIAKQGLSSGQTLRAAYLKSEVGIQSGQTVKIVANGGGFSVTNRGRALNSAARGATVRVKLDNGQIVSGIVNAGDVVDVSGDR